LLLKNRKHKYIWVINTNNMKKIKLLSIALSLGSLMFITSCSNQMYSYREKVTVNKEVAKAKPVESIKEIEAKSATKIELPATIIPAPEMALATAPKVETSPKMEPVIKDIEQMVPQKSSKAFTNIARAEMKSMKEQVKNLKKDIQKAQSNSVSIDGKKWMIVGAILVIAGWLLAIVIGGSGLFTAISGIGSLIFLIGLIFFLIDILA
jgi:soluble cytochrome b562